MWKKINEKKLIKLVEKRLNDWEIAKKMDITEDSVRNKRKRL